MQIKNINVQKYLAYVKRLQDVRFAGQVVFVVLVLMVSWSGIKSIQTNYGLQKQISALKQQNSVQQLENNNLSLENEYYDSKQYLELAARQNFSLAANGEKEVIVPAKVALSYTVDVPVEQKDLATPEPVPLPPAFQRNLSAWVDFFLHRQSAQ